MAIESWWAGSVAAFLVTGQDVIDGRLAHQAQLRHRRNPAQQLRAWREQCALLRAALAGRGEAGGWWLLFEVSLPRMGRRADAVLLAGASILVLEFKMGAEGFDAAAREQVEDFALDLHDFHEGSRAAPIVPVLIASAAGGRVAQAPLVLAGAVAAVVATNAAGLAGCLRDYAPGGQRLEKEAWCAAAYRPVAPIIEAATRLYRRHQVEEILDARAGTTSLAATSGAILEALAAARATRRHVVLFVTGVPGAGKTLCGLDACFGAADDDLRATFLTGNPSLVHVLREALARDAIKGGVQGRAARQRMEGVIQALPKFRDHYAGSTEIPAERVVVIDEAQRSWSREYAVRKSADRAVQLSDSEPAHLLEAMGRHEDWAGLVCLIGQGQEIHDGEGGLAEWGRALAGGRWEVVAAPDCLTAAEARRRLPALPLLRTDARLHLTVPTRQIGHPTAADWVDAVLEGDAARAAAIGGADAEGVPYWLVRDLDVLRRALRRLARGSRRAGLVASSGAQRLRAEGLGVEVPHMDAGAVAGWFLDRWPDVRASDALEAVATEFSVQGLELDVVGLCWDGDLIRVAGQTGWQVRRFVGTDWQTARAAERVSNRVNSYRVLLTRARHETVVFVPRGDARDGTRDPVVMEQVAAFLLACGVRPWVAMEEMAVVTSAGGDLFDGV